MTVVIKTPQQKVNDVQQATAQIQKQGLTEQSSLLVIGDFITTGAPFSRAFPNYNVMNQWFLSGAAADVEVSRIVPIVTFVA